MKEKDIDKIFSEALHNEVEPTYLGDWENFEKSLPSNDSKGFMKYGLLGIFGLIALSGMTIWTVAYFGNSEKRHYSERVNNNDSSIELPVSGNGIVNLNNRNISSVDNDSTILTSDDPENPAIKSGIAKKGSTGNSKSDENVSVGYDDITSSNSTDSKTESDRISAKQNTGTEESPAYSNTIQNQSKSDGEETGNDSKLKYNGAIAETASSNSNKIGTSKTQTSETTENSQQNQNLDPQELADTNLEIADMQTLNALSGIIPQNIPEAQIPVAAEAMAIQKASCFEPILFIAIEQNAVLKTAPQFGVVGQWHFSKWTAGVGVALQRSGTLNWTQTSTSTSYGFAKYENTTQIRTESIDLLSFPVKISRRIGGLSHVFVGYSPAFVVNAGQQKTVLIDGTPASSLAENGYLYKTDAPTFISFFSAGCGYDLDERWNLEIGVNASFQKWSTSNKTPIGGFLRLNYRFK